jgi:hypothetical protein
MVGNFFSLVQFLNQYSCFQLRSVNSIVPTLKSVYTTTGSRKVGYFQTSSDVQCLLEVPAIFESVTLTCLNHTAGADSSSSSINISLISVAWRMVHTGHNFLKLHGSCLVWTLKVSTLMPI